MSPFLKSCWPIWPFLPNLIFLLINQYFYTYLYSNISNITYLHWFNPFYPKLSKKINFTLIFHIFTNTCFSPCLIIPSRSSSTPWGEQARTPMRSRFKTWSTRLTTAAPRWTSRTSALWSRRRQKRWTRRHISRIPSGLDHCFPNSLWHLEGVLQRWRRLHPSRWNEVCPEAPSWQGDHQICLSFCSFKVTNVELDEMINAVDRNGDGKISFSEFR